MVVVCTKRQDRAAAIIRTNCCRAPNKAFLSPHTAQLKNVLCHRQDKTYHSLRKWPTEGEAVSAIWHTLALIHSNGFQNVQIDINKPQFDIENENAPEAEAEAESRQNVKFAIFKHCKKYENTQRGLRLRMQMLLIRGSALCIR